MTSDTRLDASPTAARAERPRDKPWKVRVLRRRQRELGLRRQHAARVLRRPVPPLRDLRQGAAGEQARRSIASGAQRQRLRAGPKCMMRERREADGRALAALLHAADGNWEHKGSATQFDEDEWSSTLRSTLRMDELITNHAQIMDKYDPEKRVGLSSTNGAPGTTPSPAPNPAFCTSRTRCATRWSRRQPQHLPRATPTACAWRTSRRWSTCCRR